MYISKPCILELGLKPDLVYNPSLVASKALLCDHPFNFFWVASKSPLKLSLSSCSTPDIGLNAASHFHLSLWVPFGLCPQGPASVQHLLELETGCTSHHYHHQLREKLKPSIPLEWLRLTWLEPLRLLDSLVMPHHLPWLPCTIMSWQWLGPRTPVLGFLVYKPLYF